MFVDKQLVSELDYVALLYVFNSSMGGTHVLNATNLRANMRRLASPRETELCLDALATNGLISFRDKDLENSSELKEDGFAALTWGGVAFLINHANEYILGIQRRFKEVPEKLIASLVPYLNLKVVPAADRYVDVNDNRPDFEQLIRDLEIIRDEIARDENKNEYPIPEKRAVVAELDGVLAQLKRGYVRLSTLTTRVRPLLHEVAETCKDVAVIGGTATAALWTIAAILAKMI